MNLNSSAKKEDSDINLVKEKNNLRPIEDYFVTKTDLNDEQKYAAHTRQQIANKSKEALFFLKLIIGFKNF